LGWEQLGQGEDLRGRNVKPGPFQDRKNTLLAEGFDPMKKVETRGRGAGKSNKDPGETGRVQNSFRPNI